MHGPLRYEIRRAGPADVDGIAAAHLDSIQSLGAPHYSPAIVSEWGRRVTGDLYVRAMANGEVFFIAVGEVDGRRTVMGFSTHRVLDGDHRTAVYVRGIASRRGVGSALFRAAEADALRGGAASIHVAASLAAVAFYRANGFEEIGRGEHRLSAECTMPCVFMRKIISRVTEATKATV